MAAQYREPAPLRGQYYKHQKLFQRYMRDKDRIFNIQETGTGKTCAFVALAEFMKKNPGMIQKVYVFEKGKTTKNDFKHQIACKCTAGEYEMKNAKKTQKESARKGNVTREIKKWYEVVTYKNFANQIIKKKYTDEEIINIFSGCMFLVDEAHNLRNTGDDTSDEKELEEVYSVLWRVFHLIKRSKVVVSTATPAINDVSEIAKLANLVLPADKQLPLDWDYTKVTAEQMEPYFRGRVTFVRNLDTGAVPIFQGDTIDYTHEMEVPDPNVPVPEWIPGMPQPEPRMITKNVKSQVVVYQTFMSADDIQDQAYQRVKDDATKFRTQERQASNFVFPDGSIGGSPPTKVGDEGKGGFGSYVTMGKAGQYSIDDDFKRWLGDPENLRSISCKFAAIVDIETQNTGCSFVYTAFVSGGGAIMLGLTMEAYGFEKFSESQSVFVTRVKGEESICAGSSGSRTVRANYPKTLRYAILTRETTDAQMAAMLELFNSEDNVNGEYIQMIIGSPVARDGINLYNVVRGHLLDAGWHPSGEHQALSRFLRATSHEYKLNQLRQALIDEGKDPATAMIEVKIYKHASIDSTGHSVDIEMYILSELKNLYIRRMMRILKVLAVDCQIHYSRNVRTAATDPLGERKGSYDKDGSAVCDYDQCDYKCFSTGPADPNQLDYSSYDILYADEVVDAVIQDLKQLLRSRDSITFSDLMDLWVKTGQYRDKYIYMAIDKLLTDKQQLLDRFGFSCYLRTDGTNIFTQQEYPVGSDTLEQQELATYSSQIIAVDAASFDKLVVQHQTRSQKTIIDQINEIQDLESEDGKIQFNIELEKLSVESKVKLLENAIDNLVSNNKDIPLDIAVRDRLRSYIYLIPEPWADIQKSAEVLSKRAKSKRSANSKTKPNIPFVGPPEEGSEMPDGSIVENVYLHTLYNADTGLTSYAIASEFGKAGNRIRILKTSDQLGWRDVNEYEYPAYANAISRMNADRIAEFEEYDVYGTILRDRRFRIRDKTNESIKKTKDDRMRHFGRVCDIWDKADLLMLLQREGYITPTEVEETLVPPWSRNEKIAYLIKKKYTKDPKIFEGVEDDVIDWLMKWYVSNVSRPFICGVIQKHFKETGRILQV